MKYRVRVELVLEFGEGEELELPSQDPGRHDSEIATLLEQGKRCILRYHSYGKIEGNFSPVDLRVGDVIYHVDGDGWEVVVGEVASVDGVVE
jgi:hypothetical protein